MLLDNFYTIRSFETEDQKLKANLEFDPGHKIFGGHFPSVPVVPGVCMMHIIKELLEKQTGLSMRVQKVSVMKFMTLINPQQSANVQAELSYSLAETGYQVTASLFNEGVVYFKFKGVAFAVARTSESGR